MSETIYVVSEDSYCGYPSCSFVTRKLAEAHLEQLRAEDQQTDAFVYELVLMDEPPEKVTVYRRDGRVDGRGNTVLDLSWTNSVFAYGSIIHGPAKPIMKEQVVEAPACPGEICVRVDGADQDRVEELYRTHLAQARATQRKEKS